VTFGRKEVEMKAWKSMEMTSAGHVGDVLQLGGGKLSVPNQPDYGQEINRSPKGQEK
jgi:hypothetical protein